MIFTLNIFHLKTIFQLALNNTDLGKIRAANALARLACNTEIQCDDVFIFNILFSFNYQKNIF